MKILVVDDQELVLAFVKKYLEEISNEYEIILCSDPKKAVNIVFEEEIDIVFLDIIMGEISGISVLEQIRSRHDLDDVQVIMLTAVRDDTAMYKECFDKGANNYLKKPIDFIELQTSLKAAVNTRNNAKKLKEMNADLKIKNDELHELNRKLKETQFQMIQNEKLASIGQLAAGIAHEINNPLGFVSSNLETLQNFVKKIKDMVQIYRSTLGYLEDCTGCEAEGRLYFENIRETERKIKLDFVMEELELAIKDSRDGIERVAKIVRSLRSFARTGTENEFSMNSIAEIIEEALIIVRNEAKYNIDIEKDIRDIPEVYCNKVQIAQVIINILVNAIQAIKDQQRTDRGKIIIKAERLQDYAAVEISDDGPGIPEKLMGKIFDPFFTTKEIGQGTGLGLSISHDIIVNKHKGDILVRNNEFGGASFKIRIPITQKGE